MARLTAAQRKKLPAKDFGEPAKRKYPLVPPPHAALAKSRATQMHDKGLMSAATEHKIDRRANRVIAARKHSKK